MLFPPPPARKKLKLIAENCFFYCSELGRISNSDCGNASNVIGSHLVQAVFKRQGTDINCNYNANNSYNVPFGLLCRLSQ
jgi:hypothetical protein